MPPTRIPTESDFAPLYATHPAASSQQHQHSPPPIALVYPDPPESTTAILILLHGLGDSERALAALARTLNLPGVLAVAVRGVSPLPPALLPQPDDDDDDGNGDGHGEGRSAARTMRMGFHWGDDLRFDQSAFASASGPGGGGGGIDPDPGFEKARDWIMRRLIGDVLLDRCGWAPADLLLFGLGQGGSLALGLASALRAEGLPRRVQDVGRGEKAAAAAPAPAPAPAARFKGVVSVGGPLPASMVPSGAGGLGRAATPALVLCGRESEAVDEDAADLLEREFADVRVVRWRRAGDGMPQNREEALPMMQFLAERLRSGGWF